MSAMQSCKKSFPLYTILLLLGLIVMGCTHHVLIVGGLDNNGHFLNTAETYDPINKVFIQSSNLMQNARMSATATTMSNGAVLIAGGQTPAASKTADIYLASNDTFTPTADMQHYRVAHVATLLNGAVVAGPQADQILLTGGDQFSNAGTAELYNPSTNTFRATGNMLTPRTQHTAQLISHCGCAQDGKVLVVGGYNNQSKVLASAEIYDPVTETFKPVGSMHTPRFRHTATLLNDGTVLITGGLSQFAALPDNINPALDSAEIYDPKTGKFTLLRAKMHSHRAAHSATLLRDQTVLIAGGQDDHFLIENTAEIYNPTTKSFTALAASCAGSPPPNGCMQVGRDFHVAQLLDDGTVLLAGGVNSAFQTVASAEIYTPANKTFAFTASMHTARTGSASSFVLKP